MSLTDDVATPPTRCTVLGARTGTPESAFECAASSDPGTVAALWLSLAAVAFMALWLRLVWQSWKKVTGSKDAYTWADLMNVIIWPPALFILVFGLLFNF